MSKYTIMIIPNSHKSSKQFELSGALVWFISIISLVAFMAVGYVIFDYTSMRDIQAVYQQTLSENRGLKSEAKVLMNQLTEVRRSLLRVHDYTTKLTEISNVKIKKIKSKTGIGPLSVAESEKADQQRTHSMVNNKLPLGIKLETLFFRPVFDRLNQVGQEASLETYNLQQLLSNLSQHRSILRSIPSITPVKGWITSGYGVRVSPFTGERSMHKGIDVAAAIGSPVYAPASGVVIFSGAKEGYGNFIMVAHGNGVVSRYGHNAENMVQIGQRVERGDQIATVGTSGRTTGPHVHYEILVNGLHVDPNKFILNL